MIQSQISMFQAVFGMILRAVKRLTAETDIRLFGDSRCPIRSFRSFDYLFVIVAFGSS